MNCGAEGCTGVHHCAPGNYADRCPRTKASRGVTSLATHTKYNGSTKGALRKIRAAIRQKEARLHGETD